MATLISTLYQRALRALQLSPRVFYHYPDRLDAPPKGHGSVTWVLSRAICHFKTFDLVRVPSPARTQALALQLGQTSPFAHTGHHTVWRDGIALVWYWDQAAVERSMGEAKTSPRHAKIWPESVLYQPLSDGLHLVSNLLGVEGQWWDNGRLLHCRWWRATPTSAGWLEFQRDIGLATSARQSVVPVAQTLPLRARPDRGWDGQQGYAPGWRDERLAYALGVVVLFAPTAWMGSGLLQTKMALKEVTAAIKTQEASAKPQMVARTETLRIVDRSNALLALYPYPDMLDLMARVAGVLPKGGSYVKEWDFQDGKLKVALVTQGPPLSSSALVNSLQQVGGFDNIQIVPGNDPKVVVITAEVARLHGSKDV
jgi:hypothetical protein